MFVSVYEVYVCGIHVYVWYMHEMYVCMWKMYVWCICEGYVCMHEVCVCRYACAVYTCEVCAEIHTCHLQLVHEMCLQVKCACGVYSVHGGVSMYGVKVHAFGCGMHMCEACMHQCVCGVGEE